MFAKRFYSLNPYVPGEQPNDSVYIKLNANENPYPPSPEVSKVLQSFESGLLRLYPDPESLELREAIASMLGNGITKEMIFAGNGSDEALSFLFYTFFDSDAPLYFPEHTYSFYPVYSDYYGIPYKKIPLNTDFSINASKFLEGESSGIIFPNPNAPTGIFISLEKIRYILDNYPSDRAVIIDEAYIDFGGESAITLLPSYKNLLIVRTFSKSFCFAGARLGFIIAHPDLISAITTTKNSFNHFPVDILTQKIGIASCKDFRYYRNINSIIAKTRDDFTAALKTCGWEVIPSLANFVFTRKEGINGKTIYERIKSEGILVRFFNHPGLTDFVRISVGTTEDMNKLLKVMKNI